MKRMRHTYENLLRLYPRQYQASFAREMTAVFAQRMKERRGHGWTDLLRFVSVELAGLLIGAGAEWITRLRQSDNYLLASPPPAENELLAAEQRLEWTLRRMEYAIAHHQFQKARFYSDEEHRERENLHRLQEPPLA